MKPTKSASTWPLAQAELPRVLLHEDAQTLARFADPFAAVFWVQRLTLALLGLAVVGLVVQGVCLYRLGQGTAAHVYAVQPDGQTQYVGERTASAWPQEAEIYHVAKTFVALLYAWNSSTIDADVAEAVGMCQQALGHKLRQEFADEQFVDQVRRIAVRSEMSLQHIHIKERGRRFARVALEATVSRYGLSQYDGAPLEERQIAVEVVLQVVPRSPELRLQGLEVVQLQQLEKMQVPQGLGAAP